VTVSGTTSPVSGRAGSAGASTSGTAGRSGSSTVTVPTLLAGGRLDGGRGGRSFGIDAVGRERRP